MRGFYEWLYAPFFLIKCAIFLMFEGLPETSEEGLTLELSVFESLYGGQFELSIIELFVILKNHSSFQKFAPLYFDVWFS